MLLRLFTVSNFRKPKTLFDNIIKKKFTIQLGEIELRGEIYLSFPLINGL